jgi:hypothetical protein
MVRRHAIEGESYDARSQQRTLIVSHLKGIIMAREASKDL